MPRKRTKKSVFCDKAPSTGVTNGIVYFKAENIWRICKGKLYKNGYFRYYHNGQVAVVGPRNYKVYPDLTPEQLEFENQRLNLQLLEWGHPRPFRVRWREVLEEAPGVRPPTPPAQGLQHAIETCADILTNANIPPETPPAEIPDLLTEDERTILLRVLEDVPLTEENG